MSSIWRPKSGTAAVAGVVSVATLAWHDTILTAATTVAPVATNGDESNANLSIPSSESHSCIFITTIAGEELEPKPTALI